MSPLRSLAATEGSRLDFRAKMQCEFSAVAFAGKQKWLADQLLEVRTQPTNIVAGAGSSSSEINDSNHVFTNSLLFTGLTESSYIRNSPITRCRRR